jgi:hypothetical protein
MKFRSYCIVVMGETSGCKLEIGKIAEDSPRFLEAKGIVISTFTSIAEVSELTDYFKSLNRNFLIFDTDPETSGYFLTNEGLNDALFGHISKEYDLELEDLTNKLIDDVSSVNDKASSGITSYGSRTFVKPKTRYRKEMLKEMGKKDREKLMNEILDKGVDNLTDHDKEILEFLTKM